MLILAGICLITAAFYLSRTDPGKYPADLVREFPNLTVQVSDETRLENGKVVVDLYYEVLCPDSRSFVLHQLYPAWQGLKDIFTINYIPYGKALVRRLDKFELYRIQFNQFKEFNGPQKTIPTNCWQNSNPFSYKEHFLTQILAELEHFHWQPS